MTTWRWFHESHRFRLALCGHKAAEAGGVCLLLMVGGNLLALTPEHFVLASKTGILSVLPAVAISFTPYARHLINRWTSSALLGICTFAADAAVHPSHYTGEFTEAALTGLGAFVFSVAVSYTPVGKSIDRLAHGFLHHSAIRATTIDEGVVRITESIHE
jgi:hypothetical protein